MIQEIKNFILHLRLYYQFFILSGGYLLGGLLADQMQFSQFWLQFLNVHVLLYGGATAFNSFWDKDEGPIGGLKHPPKMTPWMHKVSLLLMLAGWIWAITVSWAYFTVYGISLILFWLYSTPHARWKGEPILSLIAIGISTGLNSVFLGFWAAGGAFSTSILFSGIGASLILLSLYPVSQIYQADEDSKRGDVTFFVKFGLSGVQRFFLAAYVIGLVLMCIGFFRIYSTPAIVLFIVGLLSFAIINSFVAGLEGNQKEYQKVMNIKFFASLSFVIFLLTANIIRYEWIGETFLSNYF
ncbi:MAG: UbiA family prenyltransferase [Balneolaceae bacterium]|nr:UbiA family prenyltransferase [Balneolaceae bacterium]MDR9407445.1 UbiA family prenyltransferase [Balneolaceae bacterium]